MASCMTFFPARRDHPRQPRQPRHPRHPRKTGCISPEGKTGRGLPFSALLLHARCGHLHLRGARADACSARPACRLKWGFGSTVSTLLILTFSGRRAAAVEIESGQYRLQTGCPALARDHGEVLQLERECCLLVLMMMILLLFLQKQNLVYIFFLVSSTLPRTGCKLLQLVAVARLRG
jgi:hypothetical protein